jgi:hypothetical protein
MTEETPGLRRSTRTRKPISYKDLEEPKIFSSATSEVSEAHTNATSADLSSGEPPSEEDDEDEEDEEDYFSEDERPTKRRSGRKLKKQLRSAPSYTSKLGPMRFPSARDLKLYTMSGTDQFAMDMYTRRIEKWKDVLAEIPEELLDYTAGWGVCQGDWAGQGGEGQQIELISKEFHFLATFLTLEMRKSCLKEGS